MNNMIYQGEVLLEGAVTAPTLVLEAPLSLWGGLDPATGEIIDRRHPQSSMNVKGKIVILPSGRGSSSASSILLEAIRAKVAPAAIVMRDADGILALGAVVAHALYEITIPMIALHEQYDQLITHLANSEQIQEVKITSCGQVTIV